MVCGCIKGLVPKLRPTDAILIHRIDVDEEDRAMVAADLGIRSGTLAVRLHRARAPCVTSCLLIAVAVVSMALTIALVPRGCKNPEHATHCADKQSTDGAFIR
ncbi:hypothetical protein [Roseibium aggregatum]|uniref:hypothetical protein n=1 Tax=Roseibium aggregatum TaxID=187304 RepID=UPI001E48C83E|nr:hypothetical protein [Roseibium aggregatum]